MNLFNWVNFALVIISGTVAVKVLTNDVRHHAKYISKLFDKIDELEKTISSLAERVAKIEGRMNSNN